MKRSLYRLVYFIKKRAPWPIIWRELCLLGKKVLQGVGLWRRRRYDQNLWMRNQKSIEEAERIRRELPEFRDTETMAILIPRCDGRRSNEDDSTGNTN